MVHSLRQAINSSLFDSVCVSSDDPDLLQIAKNEGVMAIPRPHELAIDSAPKLPAITHAVITAEEMLQTSFDTVVDLDATSPLRTIEDIAAAVNLLETQGLASVVSATKARRSPYFNQIERKSSGWGLVMSSQGLVTRRQDSPEVYDLNASIYAWSRNSLLQDPRLFYSKSEVYVMPEERSWDIDSELDFNVVEFLMGKSRGEGGGN